MPSTRDPVVVVQPGPGRLPANTVPANALIFPPGGGSSAALTAHITDPVGAHAATAISTTAGPAWLDGNPNNSIEVQAALAEIINDLKATAGSNRTGQPGFTGETWAIASGSLSSALSKLYEGTNARPMWVLDANPAEKADFVGPNALINAIAAIGTHRPVIYLRPGTYNWNDAVIFNDVVITSTTGNPQSVGAQAIINNSAGNIRVGLGATFQNVTLQATGVLNIPGNAGVGFNKFDNVNFQITGDVLVASGFNNFVNCYTLSTPIYMDVTVFGNTFMNCLGFQTRLHSFASYTRIEGFQGFTLKYPANPGLSVETDHNIVTSVAVQDSLATGTLVNVSGSHNRLDVVTLSSASAVGSNALDITGSYNTLSDVEIFGLTSGSAVAAIRVTGDSNQLQGVSLSNLTGFSSSLVQTSTTATDNIFTNLSFTSFVSRTVNSFVYLLGNNNRLVGVVFENITNSGVGVSALYLDGDGNYAEKVRLQTVEFRSPVIRLAGVGCTVRDVRATAVNALASTYKFLSFEDQNCRAEVLNLVNVDVDTGTTLLDFTTSAVGCSAVGVDISTLNSAAGKVLVLNGSNNTVDGFHVNGTGALAAGFELASILGIDNCLLHSHVAAIPSNAGATAPLFGVVGANAQLDGVLFENIGTTSGVTVPLIRVSGGHGSIGNVKADGLLTTMNCGRIIDLVSITNGYPLRIHDVHGDNSVLSTENAFHSVASGIWTVESSYFAARGAGSVNTSATVFVENCFGFVFKNVLIGATQGHAAAFPNAGGALENVLISGQSGAPNAGRQLFHGYGIVTGGVTIPLQLRGCLMQVGTSNVNPTAFGVPTIFFGGQGATPVVDHGPVEVDGLVISGTGLTSWNRSSILAIDVKGQGPSSYANISVSLGDVPWTQNGNTGSVFPASIDAFSCVVEIDGPAAASDLKAFGTKIQNLSVTGAINTAAAVNRHIVKAVGCAIDGLIIDGPQAGVNVGNFAAELLVLAAVYLDRLELFPRAELHVGGSDYLVTAISSRIRQAHARNLDDNSGLGVFNIALTKLQDSLIELPIAWDKDTVINSIGYSDITGNEISALVDDTLGSSISLIQCTFGGNDRIVNNVINSSHAGRHTSALKHIYTTLGNHYEIVGNKINCVPGAARTSGTSGDTTNNGHTLTDTGHNFITEGVAVGDLIVMTTPAANAGYYRVTTVAATVLGLDRATDVANTSCDYTIYQGGTGTGHIYVEACGHSVISNNIVAMTHGCGTAGSAVSHIGVWGLINGTYPAPGLPSVGCSLTGNVISDFATLSVDPADYGGLAFIGVTDSYNCSVTGNTLRASSNRGFYYSNIIQASSTFSAFWGGWVVMSGNSLNGLGGGAISLVSATGANAGTDVYVAGGDPLNAIL